MNTRLIAAANTHTFFQGDPVYNLNTGYIDDNGIGSIPTQGTLGVFIGCRYLANSAGGGSITWKNNYPGSGSSSQADIQAYVIDDPMVVFGIWVGTGSASASGGPVTQAYIGSNFNWQKGTGNSLSGISGAYLDFASHATTATLPLTVVGLVQAPPGVNGTDITTAGNYVEVVLNQQAYKVGTTGFSGG